MCAKIVAKLRVASITKTGDGTEVVEFKAVYGNNRLNNNFAKDAPRATMTMEIDNPDAYGSFMPDRDYFISFRLATDFRV